MEEERVKSALELALERISSLPELTPEEVAAQKRKQYGPLGEALAVKYLSGAMDGDELPAQLNSYEGEQKTIVREAALAAFCRALDLERDREQGEKALCGIGLLSPELSARVQGASGEFARLRDDFESECKKRMKEYESAVLSALGLAGSAVRPNLSVNERWLEELRNIREEFEPALERLRSALRPGV